MKKITKQKAFEIIIITAFIIILFFFYKCPFKLIFGIDCAGCGMTRAYKALLRLDFISAFKYHSLFPIPIMVCIYQVFRKRICIGERNEKIGSIIILLLFLIRWILKIFL